MTTKQKIRALGALVVIALLSVSPSCRNPLMQVGLGDKVDLEVPELSVTNTNGDYVGGTVTLSGTYADDIEVQSVRVSLDGGAFTAAVLDTVNHTWSLEIDTIGYSDGEHEVIILATDASGKVIEKRLLLFVDNKPPVLLVKTPQGYVSNEFNGEFSIKGEAADQFGISLVTVEVLNSLGAQVQAAQDAVGTNSWSFLFDSKALLSDGSADFRFRITAYDKSLNPNTYLYHYDDVYAAAGSQTVTVEDLNKIDQGDPVTGISAAQADAILATWGLVRDSRER